MKPTPIPHLSVNPKGHTTRAVVLWLVAAALLNVAAAAYLISKNIIVLPARWYAHEEGCVAPPQANLEAFQEACVQMMRAARGDQ